MFNFVVLPIALASFVVAQSASNPALEVEAIKVHFRQAGIVPAGLPTFDPSAVLVADYAGVGGASPGQALTRAQVGPAPAITVTPANSSVPLSGAYTLAMVDFGAVGSDQSAGVTRHWLVNGVTIDNNAVSNASAIAITQYAGPAPPAGSGPHRYAFLLFSQPDSFAPPADFSQPNIGVSLFDINAYARDSGLGVIVAGNYITVEEGTATASLSATSAVETSILAPVSTSSGASSGGSSSTRTSSSTASTSTAPGGGNANQNGAAAFTTSLGWLASSVVAYVVFA
ncbi:PEBP-like protein [Pleurotus eryngii]|uniref:PEBP-like protein n=1 Tax=Pleurotus eryngii TaxID=5323 RepID=A0A9P6DFZ2_PLEER|nr:PEBP-like protein [Pleurotus eryngii]